jgi:hypothetical protein
MLSLFFDEVVANVGIGSVAVPRTAGVGAGTAPLLRLK